GRGIGRDAVKQALETFRSVRRRMDVKGEVDGIVVVDDFAHHPTAVRATIEAARLRWPGRRLWAILEPRSNSMRRRVFQDVLPPALALGDCVLLGGVHRAGQLSEERWLAPFASSGKTRAFCRERTPLPIFSPPKRAPEICCW